MGRGRRAERPLLPLILRHKPAHVPLWLRTLPRLPLARGTRSKFLSGSHNVAPATAVPVPSPTRLGP